MTPDELAAVKKRAGFPRGTAREYRGRTKQVLLFDVPALVAEAERLHGILDVLHCQAQTARQPNMADYLEGLPDAIEEAWREANLPACTAAAPADYQRPDDWHHPDAVDEGSDVPGGVHVWRCPHCRFVWEV